MLPRNQPVVAVDDAWLSEYYMRRVLVLRNMPAPVMSTTWRANGPCRSMLTKKAAFDPSTEWRPLPCEAPRHITSTFTYKCLHPSLIAGVELRQLVPPPLTPPGTAIPLPHRRLAMVSGNRGHFTKVDDLRLDPPPAGQSSGNRGPLQIPKTNQN